MGSKVDDIIEKLPVKVLPPIIREPDYETIKNIFQCLYINAATLPTTLGGYIHRRISLIMKNTLYATIAYNVYAETARPWMIPNIPGALTSADCAQQ